MSINWQFVTNPYDPAPKANSYNITHYILLDKETNE